MLQSMSDLGVAAFGSQQAVQLCESPKKKGFVSEISEQLNEPPSLH